MATDNGSSECSKTALEANSYVKTIAKGLLEVINNASIQQALINCHRKSLDYILHLAPKLAKRNVQI